MLFAALLGYNPVQTLLGNVIDRAARQPRRLPHRPHLLPVADLGAVPDGLAIAFDFAIAACLVAAAASWFMGEKFVNADDQHETEATPVAFGQPEVGAPEPEDSVPDEESVGADASRHEVARP